MFILKKLNYKETSRKQINIRGVKDDILLLPGRKYRMVLKVSAINFELKSEAEKDSIIEIYKSVLNSLPCPIQILIRTRELDINKYLEAFNNNKNEEIDIGQINSYKEFVKSLIKNNKILARNFYVVVPYDDDKNNEFNVIKNQLILRTDILSKNLNRLGLATKLLSSLEIMDLFYSFFNLEQSKTQPITDYTIKLLKEVYV